nr:integrase, catalytic region, zinc finger, CCHC-type, peptidase aspartic, catalytic [Tanacetum cinerariifolium]
MQISQLKETRSDADRTLDFRALDCQITQLTEKVLVLQEQSKLFRVENAKVKQHYKELYDSIKIMRTKHIDQTTPLLTKNENLKVQINSKQKCVTIDYVTPKVLAHGKVLTTVGYQWKPTGRIFTLGEQFSLTRHDEVLPNLLVVQSLQDQIMVVASSFKPLKLCEDLGKLQPTADIGIFSGYAQSRKGYRIYNKRTRRPTPTFMTSVHISSGLALHQQMASANNTSGLAPQRKESQPLSGSTYISLYFNSLDQSKMAIKYAIFERENSESNVINTVQLGLFVYEMVILTLGYISSGLVQKSVSSTPYVPPSKKDYEIMFQPLFDEYFNPPPRVVSSVSATVAAIRVVDPAGSLLSTTIDQDVPSAKMMKKAEDTENMTIANYINEDLGKLQPTADIGIFSGYAQSRKGYRIYNKRTRRPTPTFMTSVHISSGLALHQQMASANNTSGLAPQRKERENSESNVINTVQLGLFVYEMVILTLGYISSGLVQNSVSPTPYVPPSKKDYEIMFQPLFDEYFNPPPRVVSSVSATVAALRVVDPAGSLLSTTIDQDVPSASTSPTN